MLSLRSHVTTSSTLLCLPSRFHKKLFSLKLLFSLGTIHLCQPHGRKAGGGGDLKSVTCLWILLFLHNIYVVLFCRWRGFFRKLIFCGRHTCMTLYSAWLWLFFFLSIFFTNYGIWSSRGVKSQKHWSVLYNKWTMWIDTSWTMACVIEWITFWKDAETFS